MVRFFFNSYLLRWQNVEKPHPINVGDIMQRRIHADMITAKATLMNFTTLCIIAMRFLITMFDLLIDYGVEDENQCQRVGGILNEFL